ncbi:SWR1-complex protein 4 [Cyphellophora attinorum]|uniref:SWR1-complex protein 4 n=1 Tax=Cyphellophora attinorum TaxID=1664694 RepID=A0A0N1H622_9EURO|nr:SWR1-complex protein 4 [Phialophora attinorum]KPI37405.1 SWR1-complex protein 4 [Phialophora attinorum]
MASAGDVRDIMDLGQSGPRPPAPKKKKRLEPQVRLSGVTREVAALMGDSVPPIAIIEQKSFKSKPSIAQNLILRHWKRSIPGAARPQAATTPTDVEMSDGQKESESTTELRFEEEIPYEKWNIATSKTTYNDEQYDAHFKTEDWTRQETDYLMALVSDFDKRWILIGDRYDPAEIPGEIQYPDRSTEALKQRYYTIAAKLMEIGTPPSNMTAPEFKNWETMRNFDAKNEVNRKANAEKLMERTREEAEEEKLLLEELHRITKNEEEFIALRKDLYTRLESAQPIRRTERGEEAHTAIYQSSQGLSMLLNSLLAKEKRLRRPNPAEAAQASASDSRRPSQPQYHRRETMDSTNDSPAPNKKGSVSQPQVRTLTPAEEAKFGVSHPTDRLVGGVAFRHEKINRLVMAKSQVQTSKIQAALGELGVPLRVLMATERVTLEYERLITNIHLLLDARKASEKIANEIKILEEAKRQRLGLPKEGEPAQADQANAMEVDTQQPGQPNGAGGDAEDDAAGEEDGTMAEKAADDSAMQVDDENGADSDAEGEEDDQSYAVAKNDDSEAEDDNDGAEGEDDEVEEEDENEAGKDDEEDEEDAGEDDDAEADVASGEEDEDAVDARGSDAADDDDDDDEVVQPTPSEAEEEAAEADDDAEEEEEEEPAQASRPASRHSARSHKRSASVVSEASRAGSNRSVAGRKKRR